jgi:hypothetical protein
MATTAATAARARMASRAKRAKRAPAVIHTFATTFLIGKSQFYLEVTTVFTMPQRGVWTLQVHELHLTAQNNSDNFSVRCSSRWLSIHSPPQTSPLQLARRFAIKKRKRQVNASPNQASLLQGVDCGAFHHPRTVSSQLYIAPSFISRYPPRFYICSSSYASSTSRYGLLQPPQPFLLPAASSEIGREYALVVICKNVHIGQVLQGVDCSYFHNITSRRLKVWTCGGPNQQLVHARNCSALTH